MLFSIRRMERSNDMLNSVIKNGGSIFYITQWVLNLINWIRKTNGNETNLHLPFKRKKTSRPKEPCTPRLVITKRLFGIALAPNFNLARAGAMLTVLF